MHNFSAIAILSDPRKMPGHALVIPKRHVERPWELAEDEICDVFRLVAHVQQKIIATGLGTGCDVKQNYRPFLPQGRLKVDHVHYHVLPRTFQDEHYEQVDRHEAAIFQSLAAEELDRITQLLR